MRASEILSEAVFFKGDYQSQYSRTAKPILILKNPSKSELANLLNRAEYHTVRGILSQDLLVWDASLANHEDIAEDFGVDGYPVLLDRDQFELSDSFRNDLSDPDDMEDGETDAAGKAEEATEFVTTHPAIQRLYGEVCRDTSGREFRFAPC